MQVFLRFIRQIESSSKENYLSIDKEIFKDVYLDDIYEEAKTIGKIKNHK